MGDFYPILGVVFGMGILGAVALVSAGFFVGWAWKKFRRWVRVDGR